MPFAIELTPFSLAQRFVGLKEVAGPTSNPQILAMLQLDGQVCVDGDETPWCSAFVNYICWLLRLPRSKSLAAQSWLDVGVPLQIHEARAGFDIVILSRPGGPSWAGHVGFFAGLEDPKQVLILGGNQGNAVTMESYHSDRILGIRRLVA